MMPIILIVSIVQRTTKVGMRSVSAILLKPRVRLVDDKGVRSGSRDRLIGSDTRAVSGRGRGSAEPECQPIP